MLKLITPVIPGKAPFTIGLKDKTMILGSCFADSLGRKLATGGFNVCVNPFGTIYNPASVLSAVMRLSGDGVYEKEDCVPMGAGAGKICSYEHHTSFAREDEGEFLSVANAALEEARAFWKDCNRVIVTYGTSWIWEPVSPGRKARLATGTVSNCLKRPAADFSRKLLSPAQTEEYANALMALCPDKKILFIVSPIRHFGDGVHADTLSKAALHIGVDAALSGQYGTEENRAAYFPAYEILLDELRDYRFFAEDLVHPSPTAMEIIWERFRTAVTVPGEQETINSNIRESRRTMHVVKRG